MRSLIFLLSFFVTTACVAADLPADKKPLETICYKVSPAGCSVYEDYGQVDFEGRKLDLVVFKTMVLGFSDTEKIYSDPVIGKPIQVERDIAFWMNKERLIERYSPADKSVKILKFKGKKQVQEYNFSGNAALDNAIIVPFSLRKVPNLAPGWSTKITLPLEYIVKLVDIQKVSVPAGTFQAYHFISEPEKFEVWISADSMRLPVKIKGLGGLGYTLSMAKCETVDQRCLTK